MIYKNTAVQRSIAIFAAGCFWGVQYYFDQVPGVLETEAGYIGGHLDNPSYEAVCTHMTGHAEAVKITYDPAKVVEGSKASTMQGADVSDKAFRVLLKQFFRMHDPTQLNRQGPDIGDNYRSAIFYLDEQQKQAAQTMIEELNGLGKFKNPIVTTLEQAKTFWPAEDYHQKYTEKTGRGACHVPYQSV